MTEDGAPHHNRQLAQYHHDRNVTIEECARVADQWPKNIPIEDIWLSANVAIGKRIRALKEKT